MKVGYCCDKIKSDMNERTLEKGKDKTDDSILYCSSFLFYQIS